MKKIILKNEKARITSNEQAYSIEFENPLINELIGCDSVTAPIYFTEYLSDRPARINACVEIDKKGDKFVIGYISFDDVKFS